MALDKAIELSLKTWYPKDHPLHNDPLHPAIGLAGEAGELLDLYKKEKYKNGVSWWDCVHCGHSRALHNYMIDCGCVLTVCNCQSYTPKILDELGDAWYYMRILAYQQQIELAILKADIHDDDILSCLVELNNHSSHILTQLDRNDVVSHYSLTSANNWFQMTLRQLDFTLDQVTESNWQKLKDGDNHGWKTARDTVP